MPDEEASGGLRVDAARNRELILAAAHRVFLELGADAPLDRIASEAGVGNATLYRRFPTRADLIKQVAIASMERVAAVADSAQHMTVPWDGLVRFCQIVADQRLIALFPIIGPEIESDEELDRARIRAVTALETLLGAARDAGDLRDDIAAGDIFLVLATLTRPLPGISPELFEKVRARHLGVVLAGLRGGNGPALPGRPITAYDVTEGVDGPAHADPWGSKAAACLCGDPRPSSKG